MAGVYEDVVVPSTVYEEVVGRGFGRRFGDAGLVASAVAGGSLRVVDVGEEDLERILRIAPVLHPGEAGVLALAVRLRPCHVLVDDRAARLVARALGLEVHGTLYVLRRAVDKGVLPVGEALEVLDRIVESGFRISVDLYLEARRMLMGGGK